MPSTRSISIPIHLWVVAYDIADDARRNRLAELLTGWGRRVQYSVFECRIDERQKESLRRRVQRIIDNREDSVRWYPLCLPCADKSFLLGSDIEPDVFSGEGFSIV